MKISTCTIQNQSRPHTHTHTHTETHVHTRALTDLLIKTDSVLAHLINPQRQLPGENRPHYAREKNNDTQRSP